MMMSRRHALVLASTIALAGSSLAELSSGRAVELARVLAERPETDRDKDGILSFDEYDHFFRSQGEKKPANPLSMELLDGDLLITDFEENNLGKLRQWGWKVEGDAFHGNLDHGTRMMRARAGAYGGRYFLTSYTKSDSQTGRLLSPAFEVEKPFINFLLGGGEFAGRTCVNLLIDGRVVRSATGKNDDRFERTSFAVGEWVGQSMQVEIVDAHRGLWGHVNVDQVTQSDAAWASGERLIGEPPAARVDLGGIARRADGSSPSGAAVLRDGKLEIGDQVLPIDDLLLLASDVDPPQHALERSVRLNSGEVWALRKIAFEDGKLSLHSDLFGTREIAIDQVASLNFSAGSTAPAEAEPGKLYRADGEPIPGKLIWVRDRDIAIDCALGTIPVPVENVASFVLARVKPATAVAKDEVRLADGSHFFGKLSVEGDRLVLEHTELGPIKFAWSAVRHLRRADRRVAWLDQVESELVASAGPVSPPPDPAVIGSEGGSHLYSIRMMPHTQVSYQLPVPGGGGSRTFFAELLPVPAGRADLRVRLSSGEEVLWEKVVRSSDPLQRVQVDLPDAGAGESPQLLSVEVEFAGPLAFPCGIDWRDPRVVGIEREEGAE